MSTYLLLAHTHGLLPLALRLKHEGHTVEWAPWKHRYERAWEGALTTALKGEKRRDEESLGALVELAEQGGVRVLLDHAKWGSLFHRAKHLWGVREAVGEPSPLRACGWWDGEALHAPHLILVDMGAWGGGMGPTVEGAATLLRGWEGLVRATWEPYLDALKASGHRGLVQAHLGKGLTLTWWGGGWQGLHTAAWLEGLEVPIGKVLDGAPPVLRSRYSVVMPVTVPPWPIQCDRSSAEVEVQVEQAVAGQAFWHDTRVVDGKLRVAGLDGLVAVARGSAESLGLARQRALAVAAAVRVPERQVRLDVGAQVEALLANLEVAGWRE